MDVGTACLHKEPNLHHCDEIIEQVANIIHSNSRLQQTITVEQELQT